MPLWNPVSCCTTLKLSISFISSKFPTVTVGALLYHYSRSQHYFLYCPLCWIYISRHWRVSFSLYESAYYKHTLTIKNVWSSLSLPIRALKKKIVICDSMTLSTILCIIHYYPKSNKVFYWDFFSFRKSTREFSSWFGTGIQISNL